MRAPPVGMLIAGLLVLGGCSSPGVDRNIGAREEAPSFRAFARWPRVILWAWQRPNDLSFINPQRVGVSYVVKTIRLKGQAVLVEPNLNSLEVPVGTKVMACARIEADPRSRPTLSPEQAREAAVQMASLADFPDAQAVQIDFDATASQRDFYRQVLVGLRRGLPRSFPISITALGSWCMGDDWISHLPIDEAVPMLFRMGPDRAAVLRRLEAGDDFDEPLCRQSAGISTDELVPALPTGRRFYVFNPDAWTKADLDKFVIQQPNRTLLDGPLTRTRGEIQ